MRSSGKNDKWWVSLTASDSNDHMFYFSRYNDALKFKRTIKRSGRCTNVQSNRPVIPVAFVIWYWARYKWGVLLHVPILLALILRSLGNG